MKLVMVMKVRDEVDVIERTLAYHLAQGADQWIVTDNGSMLRLTRPAIVRQEQVPAASPGAQGPRVIVQSLTTDPYGVAADIVIPLDQVTFIGVLQPRSSLGVAYGEAVGLTQPPAATPSPSS